uniref:Ig-like domain-containing protein n=1 Tax=Cyclopterus lumpus TaxID=8103 RepID=A0A8C2ZLQ3_CYCLU
MFYLLSIEMYPPLFVSKPDPMTLFVGKQAVLQCSLTGSSPMEVVWHKDNIAISEGNYVMKCEKNKYSLLIKSLELTDQGVYLCKASNSVGTATFTTELKVINKPSFVKTVEPVAAAVNDPLRLECQVDEDTGVTVTWTRDGKKVVNEAGQDKCFKPYESLTLFCIVEPPQITEKPEVIKVTVGDPVSLDCKVTGSPDPSFNAVRLVLFRTSQLCDAA